MQGHEDSVICLFEVKWYSEKKLIISGSADFSIGVWDIIKGTCAKFIKDQHKGNINTIFRLKNVAERDKDVVSAGYDGQVNFWKVDF